MVNSQNIEQLFSAIGAEMENAIGFMLGILAVFLIVAIIVYVLQAIFLNKFNKLVNGKGTALAWIPFANIYLLGTLTINKVVGWLLVLMLLFLPENYSTLNSLLIIGFYIYAIIKYFQIKKSKSEDSIPTMTLSSLSGDYKIDKKIKEKPEKQETPEVYSRQPMQIPESEKHIEPSKITAVRPTKNNNMPSNPLQDLYSNQNNKQ